MKNPLLKSKVGSFSIKFVIVSFIAIIIITGFMSVTKSVFLMNEIQGVLDTAGVSALRAGVDDNHLRVEELDINETLVLNYFYKMVNENISPGETLTSFKVKARVFPGNSPHLRSLGIPSGSRDQYFLVSEGYARYEGNPMIDQTVYTTLKFFNFFSNAEESISFSGAEEDGYVELIIRSVTRVVLR